MVSAFSICYNLGGGGGVGVLIVHKFVCIFKMFPECFNICFIFGITENCNNDFFFLAFVQFIMLVSTMKFENRKLMITIVESVVVRGKI